MEKAFMVIEEILNRQYTRGVFSSMEKAMCAKYETIDNAIEHDWYTPHSVFIVILDVDKMSKF